MTMTDCGQYGGSCSSLTQSYLHLATLFNGSCAGMGRVGGLIFKEGSLQHWH